MRKKILLFVLIAMFGFAVYEFIGHESDTIANPTIDAEDDEREIGINVGNIAPNFSLHTLDGKQIMLSDFRGKNVMINFWATWCPPCRAEMPDLQKFYEDEDIEVLAVNLTDTETSGKKVQDFVDKYSLTFPVLLDEDGDVSSLYAIQPIPTSFFVNQDGVISFRAFGAMNYETMVQELDRMNQ